MILDIAIHTGKGNVERAAAAITKLQDGRQMQINAQPIKVE